MQNQKALILILSVTTKYQIFICASERNIILELYEHSDMCSFMKSSMIINMSEIKKMKFGFSSKHFSVHNHLSIGDIAILTEVISTSHLYFQ